MSEYSGFKIKRPHSLAPLTSVYETVAVDGRPGRFALKIFHPPASTNVRRFYAIEGWLLAAERQQQAAKKDGTVVEVLACGRCAEGAFAVMPWQERFLEPWIKTLGAKGDTLRALATCLLNTVEAWEKETGGPHGNLKPANIFLGRDGPLVGMTAKLSDPAFMPGAKPEALRLADLNAVGAMLATIVRRRPPGAWPIEEAPEWKALGNAGKGWLDFCNYLLNPQPNEGEVTLAKARLRLKKVPKDANPVKTAVLTLAALLVLGTVGVVTFARFGNPTTMPEQVFRLAQKVGNTRIKPEVPQAWIDLCMAWDTWLIDLQSNGPRLLQTQDLWEPNDPLRKELSDFLAAAKDMLPESLVQEAAGEKRLGVLAKSPPEAVLNELQIPSTIERVQIAGQRLTRLSTALENWPRWNQLRELETLMEQRGFTNVAKALLAKIPPRPGSLGYKLDRARTINFLRELSLDANGALPIASRWSEISRLSTEMEAVSDDRVQKAMPTIIKNRLVDMSSISDFADSLVKPLEELQLHRTQFHDQAVVRERFLKESPLLKETTDVTAEDFPKWEQELVAFSKVPKAEDPRFAPDMGTIAGPPPATAIDLEAEAPAGEAGSPATLSKSDFENELSGLQAKTKSFQAREIVRRDVPDINKEKATLTGFFEQLLKRLEYTLTLLKPETWMEKTKLAYGKFTESQQRWAAWKQANLTGVTADQLRGKEHHDRFRKLRADERQVKDWIDGLEGPTGFGALKVPDLTGTASPDTAKELKRVEVVLRDRAVAAVATEEKWTKDAVPATKWADAGPSVRGPLDKHHDWLAHLAEFASELDQLGDDLANGVEFGEGVSDVARQLRGQVGIADLAGKPAEWYAEANQLARLEPVADRGGLLAAAQAPGAGLSRKLTVWRRLDKVDGWPAGPADFDVDVGLVDAMRQWVGQNIKDAPRRTSLLEEMGKGTRERFNRAARTASRADRAEAQLTEMFSRIMRAGLKEADLDDPVAYNLALWRLKKSDWNEKSLDRLGVRRDAFVKAVQAIPTIQENDEVKKLVTEISTIELKDNDPNRKPTPSPGTVDWHEDLRDDGLTLIATWKNVKLEYRIVQSDDTPPFYLAVRAVAVGEFLDLMAARKEAALVKEALPDWAKGDTSNKPYDRPMGWLPRSDFSGLVLNDKSWIAVHTSMADQVLDSPEARAQSRELEQAISEKPSLRSPLQQLPANAAKLFAEKMLGARLPTTKEWQAVLKVTGATATAGYFRGPNVQRLFNFLKNYHAGGVTPDWRPNTAIFTPGRNDITNDDGRAGPSTDEGKFWFRDVDEGPKAAHWVNLTGNVSIFLTGDNPAEYYVAGGSALSLPGIDFTQPQKVTGTQLIGGSSSSAGKQAFSDVGLRPAFDAPPGFKERFKLNQLVRGQKYLTL